MTGNNPPPSGVEPVMSNVEHIPTLEWKPTTEDLHPGLVADLGNNQWLFIGPVRAGGEIFDGYVLRLNGEYLNTFNNEDDAKAYARTFVGDDDA
jgi:hypothetical protein